MTTLSKDTFRTCGNFLVKGNWKNIMPIWDVNRVKFNKNFSFFWSWIWWIKIVRRYYNLTLMGFTWLLFWLPILTWTSPKSSTKNKSKQNCYMTIAQLGFLKTSPQFYALARQFVRIIKEISACCLLLSTLLTLFGCVMGALDKPLPNKQTIFKLICKVKWFGFEGKIYLILASK